MYLFTSFVVSVFAFWLSFALLIAGFSTVVVWIGTLIYDVVDDKLIASVQERLSGPGAGPHGSPA